MIKIKENQVAKCPIKTIILLNFFHLTEACDEIS